MPNLAKAAPGTAAIILVVSAVLARVVQVDLYAIGAPLADGPNGYTIVDFELAPPEKAGRILAEWTALPPVTDGTPAVDRARASLIRDFAFIPAYTTMLALMTFLAAWSLATGSLAASSGAAGRWGRLAEPATRLAWGQWLAGIFDVVENVALLRVLDVFAATGTVPAPAQWTAVVAAASKFALLLAAVAVIALGTVAFVRKRFEDWRA